MGDNSNQKSSQGQSPSFDRSREQNKQQQPSQPKRDEKSNDRNEKSGNY